MPERGNSLAPGELPVRGETKVRIDEEQVETETRIDGETTVAIFIPERPWVIEVGLNGAALEWKKRLVKEFFVAGMIEYGWRDGVRADLKIRWEF